VTSKPLRVFLGMIAHETNSFSPIPTSLRAFGDDVLYRKGGPAAARAKALAFPGYGDLAAIAAERGDELIAGLAAWTQPSAPLTAAAYQTLRDELLAELKAAGAVNVVLLNLHGAMLAEGCDDCESDIVVLVRAMVGPDTPIGVLLDLHGNIGPAMLDAGAIVVACKEYPHTDYRPRAEELYAIVSEAAGGLRPRTLMKRVPVLELVGTTEQPMRGLVDELSAREGERGILSISVMHGFPWADTPHAGACVLLVTDGSDPAAAGATLDWAGGCFFDIATSSPMQRLVIDAALDEAFARARKAGPVVVADGADNPGGGAACDSTFLLHALIGRRAENAAIGMLWDPQACAIAAAAGVGARLQLRIGGKVGPMSGPPVDVEAEVLAVRDDAMQRGLTGDLTERLGLAVAVRAGGIDIVLNTIRQQVFSTDCFTMLGVDLASKAVVVVKSIQHFRASFDEIAASTISCSAPGTLDVNLQNLPYRHLQRPIWPLDSRDVVARQWRSAVQQQQTRDS
jgi:microcystin degradation protein MlrC